MRRTVLFLLAVLPACGGEPGPMVRTSAGTVAAPVEFSVETWPGEGIPVMEARRLYLLLHEAPDPASPIVDTLLADVGAQVHFDSTRYQTVQPGSITVLSPTTVLGRDFGERSHLTYEEYYSGETGDVNIRVAPPSTIAASRRGDLLRANGSARDQRGSLSDVRLVHRSDRARTADPVVDPHERSVRTKWMDPGLGFDRPRRAPIIRIKRGQTPLSGNGV